jgi:hypothetical protein
VPGSELVAKGGARIPPLEGSKNPRRNAPKSGNLVSEGARNPIKGLDEVQIDEKLKSEPMTSARSRSTRVRAAAS